MKIYTKTGDKGTTSLVYGKRVAKNDVRVEAYGTVDELNSFIGLAISQLRSDKQSDLLQTIITTLESLQTTLFHVGAELSTPPEKEVKWPLKEEDVLALEAVIDEVDALLKPLTQFILPGGSLGAAHLHVARTIARKAERLCVNIEAVSPVALAFLNRLSDLLFVLARGVNHASGITEPILQPKTEN